MLLYIITLISKALYKQNTGDLVICIKSTMQKHGTRCRDCILVFLPCLVTFLDYIFSACIYCYRRTEDGYKESWRQKMSYFSRRMTNSRRRPLKSAGNRESYKH